MLVYQRVTTLARASAIAAPMPREAPVTMATSGAMPSTNPQTPWENPGKTWENPLSMDVLMGKSWEKHRKRWNMPS